MAIIAKYAAIIITFVAYPAKEAVERRPERGWLGSPRFRNGTGFRG